MRKPISIAMFISAGIHAALILLVAWSIDPEPVDPPVRKELVVSLDGGNAAGNDEESLSQTNGEPDDAPVAPVQPSSAEHEVPEAAVETIRVSDNVIDKGGPENASVDDAAPKTDLQSPVADFEASPSPVEHKPQAIAAVTTTASTPVSVAPINQRQRKMLDKKIRRWTETYYKHKDVSEKLTWKHKGQEYTASFADLPADDDMALDRVVVRVSTEFDGERLTTQMQMKRLAFSNYAQFVNRWDENVQIHDDELDGRFHSNSAINLAYSRDARPQFHGKVTTSARRINVTENRARARRDEVFLGGLQTGVRSIRLPKHFVPLPDSARFHQEQVHEFAEDARITFHEDGSYTWISYEDGLFERRANIRKPATYLIAKEKAVLHVKGQVRGKVLVYSPQGIVIADDLVYARDPDEQGDGGDFIGLVSAKNIEVAGPKVTGPGDMRITAAIYARRRFSVDKIRATNGGLLTIYGSLTAGSLSATEPRFATRIQFDPRLESARPPGFPVTNRYEVESWDSAWTVDSTETL